MKDIKIKRDFGVIETGEIGHVGESWLWRPERLRWHIAARQVTRQLLAERGARRIFVGLNMTRVRSAGIIVNFGQPAASAR